MMLQASYAQCAQGTWWPNEKETIANVTCHASEIESYNNMLRALSV